MKLPKNWRQHLSIEKTVYSKTEIEYTLKLTLPHKVQPIIAGYIYIIKKNKHNMKKQFNTEAADHHIKVKYGSALTLSILSMILLAYSLIKFLNYNSKYA